MSLSLLWLAAASLPLSQPQTVRGGGTGPVADPSAPLSSIAVIQSTESAFTIPQLTRRLVQLQVDGALPATAFFPLANELTDTVRSIRATSQDVVVKWLDPLDGTNAGETLRFGSNCDYVSFFGDGWNSDWQNGVLGSAPQYNGSGDAGWLWVNHEYISNGLPSATSAPTGQHLTHAKLLEALGVLTNDTASNVWEEADLNEYGRQFKRQLGGSWIRIVKDAQTGRWSVDQSAQNRRYDSTSATQVRVTGIDIGPTSDFTDHADDGQNNPASVVSGIMGDCSGATSSWAARRRACSPRSRTETPS